VISQRTIIWFVLLVLSSAALWLHTYQEGKPCREWKKTRLNASTAAGTGDAAEASFTPCDLMWGTLPLWVRVCAVTWLISLVAFIKCLLVDLYRWFSMRRQKRRLVY
jgi:hypothetical protein